MRFSTLGYTGEKVLDLDNRAKSLAEIQSSRTDERYERAKEIEVRFDEDYKEEPFEEPSEKNNEEKDFEEQDNLEEEKNVSIEPDLDMDL